VPTAEHLSACSPALHGVDHRRIDSGKNVVQKIINAPF
jgi:hypothetical protein